MKGSRHCQCWSGSSCAPTNKGPPTEQAGTSLGLSTLSSLSAAGKGRWLHLGGILPTTGQAGLPAWRWQLKVTWPRHHYLPTTLVTNASALQFALEIPSSQMSSPAQAAYRVSQIFLTHFRTWPPAPFRWGGGPHSVFPKTQLLVHYVYFLRRVN